MENDITTTHDLPKEIQRYEVQKYKLFAHTLIKIRITDTTLTDKKFVFNVQNECSIKGIPNGFPCRIA